MAKQTMTGTNREPDEAEGYHYFITSCLHWNVGMHIHKLVLRQKRQDRRKDALYKATTYAVYKVPLPLDADYRIENYKPDVPGAELVYSEEY